MWALCRRDHGLTWAEFCEITLAQLEALEERRAIAVRHARFNAALVTSAIINANRSPDSRAVSPFDFIAGMEESPEERERAEMRRSVRHAIALAFTDLQQEARQKKTVVTPERVQEEKRKMIERMTANGIEDPEGLIREVYPDL